MQECSYFVLVESRAIGICGGCPHPDSAPLFSRRSCDGSRGQSARRHMLSRMRNLSQIYRLKALAAEQRVRDSSDPAVKSNWEELAIEWHLLANAIAKANDQIPQVGFS
jgi:hypothetical protein